MDEDDQDLISGDGTPADFLHSTDSDSIYTDNQSPSDAIDNGAVTTNGSSTTVGTPGWQNMLNGILTTAGKGVSTVAPLLGSTTGGAPKAAAAAATSAKTSSTLLYIGLAAVVAVIAFLLFRHR